RLFKDIRVVLFDAQGKRLRSEPLAIDGLVSSMVFGPTRQFAVAYSQGSTGHGVAVFDDWGQRERFVPFHQRISDLAFGPGGFIVARYGSIALKQTGVVVFDADIDSWREKAGRIANRNLTWTEWKECFPDTHYRRTIRSLPWPHDLPES